MAQQQGQYSVNPIQHAALQQQSYAPQPQYAAPPLQAPQPLYLPFLPHPYNQYHPQSAAPQLQPSLHPLTQYSLPPQPTYAQPHIQAHAQLHNERPTAKRPRESATSPGRVEMAGDVPSPKRKKGQDVLFRIVVPSREIGKLIGKAGCRIQKIREEVNANIKIADAIARYEERVIIISSKDNGDEVTDAEKALHQIASLILKEDNGSIEVLKVSAAAAVSATGSVGSTGGISMDGSLGTIGGINAVHSGANAIKFLIAGSQAGGLIGVSGQNIEKIRESSGATITVLAPNQLPFCASAHESDRLVQISGEVQAVLKAVGEIGRQLRENPPKQVISISPAYNYSTTRTAMQYLDPTAAEYVTMDMLIPETMVGGLIGRCGSNISRIRNESGAMIKAIDSMMKADTNNIGSLISSP
ncbi:hypothetical protein Nepgr_023491 [Nepenthes gracilis]|uniref:K Homology domain-containing protein n=1 Tax=Nepenthes gracilis TaxID=150966 RepID=A0AAD3T369_NEPGR|nr:hypothetical protein Nepgr_023491 [Nepenthes gracilis]